MPEWPLACASLLALSVWLVLPAASPAAQGLDRLPGNEKVIALTFDEHVEEGVAKRGASETLAILRRNDIRCTFFFTGQAILARPDLVRRIVSDGHEIGNHTFSHAWVLPRDEKEDRLLGELARTQELLRGRAGAAAVPLWRAPYGNVAAQQATWARKIGLAHVGWTLDLLDWESDPRSPRYLTADGMLARFVALLDSRESRGAIVLGHLETARADEHLHSVLQRMIGEARRRGFRFVRVSERAE